MKRLLSHYWPDFVIAGIILAIVYYAFGTQQAVFTTAILAVLEISLSLDNAVVNATVVKRMTPFWQKMFLTLGILIAVVGMRAVFPLVLVGVTSGMAPIGNVFDYAYNLYVAFAGGAPREIGENVLSMAINNPQEYAHHLHEAEYAIGAFGASFLLMVAFKFFLDEEKEEHWIDAIEQHLAKLGAVDGIAAGLTAATMLVVAHYLPAEAASTVVYASMAGIAVHIATDVLRHLLDGQASSGVGAAASAGFGAFMYLEVLDASFSFDGVVGAFAVTDHIFIIMAGLGIGSLFVRSITLDLVKHGTLDSLKYLEPAAFWAIGSLAGLMIAKMFTDIPEVVSGGLSATIIIAGVVHSLIEQRNTPQLTTQE